jgi:iron complex outermembrane receptor protein
MKKTTQFLLLTVALIFSTVAMAQSTLTGTILDADLKSPLPGATVVEKGTSNGASTDFDGKFTLTTKKSSGELVISYVGYTSQTLAFSGNKDLGTIMLASSEVGLQEIQILASVAVDRKTPVAVSTIKAADIEMKLGTKEFPEILKSTPGVYATKAGGGFGDGRINLRGFQSENVAVMINGVPVNDMENGRVYWSNWAGLSDVTSSMQVQRGLGASKVAVPSIGGTINIISKTTDVEAGGNAYATLGNDGYRKIGVTYSTGLLENGLAATVSASKTDGDGYVDGTQFNAVAYFINVSKEFNENHKLSFTAFGAKQRHGQRQNSHLIETYRKSERGIKFNADWGYKNGQVTFQEDNFYHKPQISLNHYWTINEKTNISTALYASFGSGGGGGTGGDSSKFAFDSEGNSDYRVGNYGPIAFDRIVAENEALGANGAETILRASRNDHRWYGILSTLKTDLTDNLVLLGGLDLRDYKGIHFTELTDLLGGRFFADNSDKNNPNAQVQVGDKYSYYNDGLVRWMGLFGQLEYSKDKLAGFVSLAASNTAYKRIDYFLYTNDDPTRETDWYNFGGFSAKAGANYNLDTNNNVFVNAGYFERAPNFNTVFPRNNNTDINANAVNQKILSFEVGYGFRADKLSANVNVYRTTWKDRSQVFRFIQPSGDYAFANILGVNAVHQGVEVDFVYRASKKFKLTGMVSLGDWRWENNVENVDIINEDQEVIGNVDLFIKDLHVGDAAQTTMALGFDYNIGPDTRFSVDYNYFDNLYAQFDPSDRGTVKPDAWKVPSYGVFDASSSHDFKIGTFDATLSARLDNVFNTHYISDAFDGNSSSALDSRVYYGFGRTFSVGLKLKF